MSVKPGYAAPGGGTTGETLVVGEGEPESVNGCLCLGSEAS